MKYTPVKGKVRLSSVAHDMIDQLVDTGLFGKDSPECIARIVEEFLWKNSDKPMIRSPKATK